MSVNTLDKEITFSKNLSVYRMNFQIPFNDDEIHACVLLTTSNDEVVYLEKN
jgi:hypothetical protein